MNKVYTRLISALGALIMLLIIFQFLLSNSMVASGTTLEEMNSRIDVLTNENMYLARQIAISKSLESVKARAIASGFVKASSFISVPLVQAVALR